MTNPAGDTTQGRSFRRRSMPQISRRDFLAGSAVLAGAAFTLPSELLAADSPPPLPGDFPRVDPATVATFVGVCHRDPVEVKRLVERQPSLARASWDWGFGDWESGLGAASHTGQREIAHLLLAHGAHTTIFSAAMLGQLDVVKAMIAASPGLQRTAGPHGLTLLHHARQGGKDAEAVVAWLEQLGGADEKPTLATLESADRDALVGRYRFGSGEGDRFDVDVKNDRLGIQRAGRNRVLIHHLGDLVFFPSGVPTVKIAFARSGASVSQLTVADPDVFVTAKREA
jgi:hypothetical protein